MDSERSNTFKSFDDGSSTSSSASSNPGAVEKLADRLARNVKVIDGIQPSSIVIKKEVEAIQITDDEEPKSLGVNSNNDCAGGIKQAPTEVTTEPDSIMQVVESPIEQADSNGTKTRIINEYPLPQTRPEQQQEQSTVLSPPRRAVSDCGIRVKAKYVNVTADQGEISFDRGRIISIIKKLDEGWYRGSVITGEFKCLKGFFPYNQFAYTPPRDVRRVPDCGSRAVTWYDYKAIDKCNVSFDLGDKISSTYRKDEGWGFGLVVTGRFKGIMGYFPANCRYPPRFELLPVPEYRIRIRTLRAFEAASEEDLSCGRGDIISVNKQFDNGWWSGKVVEGKFKGSKGYFKHRYVEYAPLHRGSVPDCGIRAVALHDYEAADKREISFRRSDIIDIIRKVDKYWWYGIVITGKFKGLRGFFLYIYVAYLLPTDIDEDVPPQTLEQQQEQPEVLSSDASSCDATSIPDCGIRGEALEDYEASYENGISFNKKDMIRIIKMVDRNWCYGTVMTGKFKDLKGFFRARFVAFAPPHDVISAPDCGMKAKALWPFVAFYKSEISFDQGDTIRVISKVGYTYNDECWWYGKTITGRFKGSSGYFPPNFVEKLATAKSFGRGKRRNLRKKRKR